MHNWTDKLKIPIGENIRGSVVQPDPAYIRTRKIKTLVGIFIQSGGHTNANRCGYAIPEFGNEVLMYERNN